MATKLIMTIFLVLDQGGSIGTLGTPIFDTNTLPQSILPADQPHDLLIRNTVLGDALARSFSNDSSVRLVFSSSFHPNLPNFKYLRLPQASPPSPFSLLSFLLLMSYSPARPDERAWHGPARGLSSRRRLPVLLRTGGCHGPAPVHPARRAARHGPDRARGPRRC